MVYDLLGGYRESNVYVIEHRDTWNRAGEAIRSKIQENERAAAAMALDEAKKKAAETAKEKAG